MTETETTTTDERALLPITRPAHRDLTLDRLARLGQWLAASESGRKDNNSQGAAAALRFYYAEQLALPPTAVSELSVIHGRLFVSAQLMRALAERAGYQVQRVESTDETCTARLVSIKGGEVLGQTTFTIQDAKRGGLIRQGSNWQTYPARMLWARASKLVIQDFAPAVSLGMASTDEIPEYIEGQVVELVDEPGDDVDIEWPGEAPHPDDVDQPES